MNITEEQEDSINERMNIIGRNGNDGDHYDQISIKDQLEYLRAVKKEQKLYESIQNYIISNKTTFEEEYQLILNKQSGLSGKQRSYLKALQEYEPTQEEIDAHEALTKTEEE